MVNLLNVIESQLRASHAVRCETWILGCRTGGSVRETAPLTDWGT